MQGKVKVIGFEEHYKLPAIQDANRDNPGEKVYDVWKKAGRFATDAQGGWPAGIYDLGEGRIAAMDAAGIDVQILSHTAPGPETLEPSLARTLARQANDDAAAAVAKYPERFLGFATLPMLDPAAAASELERTVRDPGFAGVLINGHVNGRYLDDKFFWPVFECAQTPGVPIYLHPVLPPQPVVDTYYKGFGPYVSSNLAAAGLGWHIDTGVHAVRLILGGVFDQFPGLQVIVGHQFEALSWMAWRTDYSFQPGASGGLKRTVKEYLRENFYGGILPGDFANQESGAVDPSWSLSCSAYLSMVNLIGIDRVLFTTDYPYANMKAARQFLDQMPINPDDREKIAHLNAERLLGL